MKQFFASRCFFIKMALCFGVKNSFLIFSLHFTGTVSVTFSGFKCLLLSNDALDCAVCVCTVESASTNWSRVSDTFAFSETC